MAEAHEKPIRLTQFSRWLTSFCLKVLVVRIDLGGAAGAFYKPLKSTLGTESYTLDIVYSL